MNDIFDRAHKALSHTEKSGADEAEVYCIKGRSVSIDVHRDEIDLARESLFWGIGIRAIVNGAVGFSSTNDPGRVEEACVLAVKSARVRQSDLLWSGLPEKKKPAAVRGIFDKNIADIGTDECIEHTAEMIEGSKTLPSVAPTAGQFFCSDSVSLILNSHGVEIREPDTIINASIDTATKGKDISTASEFDVSRRLDIDFFKIGEAASRLAFRSQNGMRVEMRDTAVLLEPMAFADILDNTLLPSLDADNVQKGRSSLIGKMGMNIASDTLSLIDDGTLAGGIGTSSCDDEGTPSKRTELVKNGVLASFLYDCYTAGKENIESTGNAVRGSFTSTPSISVRNLILKCPSFDVVGETGDGVIVNTVIGAHTANPISGDFSVEARNSFLIENGDPCAHIADFLFKAVAENEEEKHVACKMGNICMD